jgi:uncharacterized protein (DUF433 family)
MTATATAYAHIVVDDRGVAWIEDANTKVVELVAEVKAYGWSPEELAYHHPHLSLAQVYSALAYYWDHREEIERDLQSRYELAETLRREVGEHNLTAKLRARGQA